MKLSITIIRSVNCGTTQQNSIIYRKSISGASKLVYLWMRHLLIMHKYLDHSDQTKLLSILRDVSFVCELVIYIYIDKSLHLHYIYVRPLEYAI